MILERIKHWARHTPDATAVEAWSHNISYLLLFRLIQSTRLFLQAQGLPQGTVCALWAGDILDQWVVSLAARSAGLHVVTLPNGELPVLERFKGLSALLLPQADFARIASQSFPQNLRKIMIPTAIYAPPVLAQTDFKLPKTPAGDHFCLSSGSTGESKLIRCKAKDEVEVAAICRPVPKHEKRKIALMNYPIFGAMGYKWGLSFLHDGCTMIIDQNPNFSATVLRPDITMTALYPQLVRQVIPLLPEKNVRPDLSVVFGGGHVPFVQVAELSQRLSPNLFNAVGASEMSTLLAYTRIKTKDDLNWNHIASGRVVEIVDEQDHILPVGEEGRLRVKLHRLDAQGYESDPAATQAAFRDGFFYTGDLAILGADGRLKLSGRASDALNISGIKMSTAWLEDQITSRIGKNACVFTTTIQENRSELHVIIEGTQAL